MGLLISKLKSKNLPAAPTITETISSAELKTIIKGAFGNSITIIKADKDYALYSKSDLERFLSNDKVDKLKYANSKFDCDDFAISLCGKERSWYRQAEGDAGSTFGILHGDLRKKETDTEPRHHAVNYFIDENKKIWLIEPQTDEISEPTSNSNFWRVFV